MPLLRYSLVCLALLSPAFGQESRKDPFLASDDQIRSMIPQEASLAQVSVQLDWIRLPHLTANQLIRQHLKRTTEGGPLYKAVLDLIAQQKAERLDLTSLLVRSGQRAKIESFIEHPYPTEFDPPQINRRVLLDGNPAQNQIAPVAPSSFATRYTGRIFEVEAIVGEDRSTIDLNLAPEWTEHAGDISWGTGPSEIQQPVFAMNRLTAALLLKNGEWQMAGLFTPPHGAPQGKLYGSAEVLPAERVLLFVRGSLDAPAEVAVPAAPVDDKTSPSAFVDAFPGSQVTVLSEWIEVDTDVAVNLLAKHPAFVDTAAIREALEPMLLNGSASLLESSAVQVRGGQRAKVESVTEFPYPTEFDTPQLSHENVESSKKSDPAPQPPAPLPATASAFATKNTGTTMEVECTVGEDHFTIDLNPTPELVFNLGTLTYGEGVSAVKQPKFQVMKSATQILTLAHSPVLLGSYDAPLREGESPQKVQKRKVLLFVRAIL